MKKVTSIKIEVGYEGMSFGEYEGKKGIVKDSGTKMAAFIRPEKVEEIMQDDKLLLRDFIQILANSEGEDV